MQLGIYNTRINSINYKHARTHRHTLSLALACLDGDVAYDHFVSKTKVDLNFNFIINFKIFSQRYELLLL